LRHLSSPTFRNAGRASRLLAVGAAGALALSAAPASAALPDGFAGIATEDAYVGSDAYQAKELGRQRTTGFTLTRQVFKWQELEPGPGIYEWSATDRFVLAAAKAKIRVMPLLYGEPAWATSRPAGDQRRVTFPPADNEAYGRFAEAVARRYGPNGAFWAANPGVNKVPTLQYQLWNEPNLSLYWGGRSAPAEYAALAVAGSKGLRRAQPDAYVVSAGLPQSKLATAPDTFIQQVLKQGGANVIDAVGVHPSGSSSGKLVAAVQKFRKAIDKKSVGGRKLDLWVTEFGWAVGGPKMPGKRVTAKQQSELIKDSYRGLAKRSKALKVKGAIYFQWRDSPLYPGVTDFWGLHTGLVDLNGKDRPALS
jgi:GH35 family endo-1,4-beta-xylanase